jgi:hypothetical protein
MNMRDPVNGSASMGWKKWFLSATANRTGNELANSENGPTPWPEEESSDAEHAFSHFNDRFFDPGGVGRNELQKEAGAGGRTRNAGLAGANNDRDHGARGAE